ncbi:hypothetical protein B0T09DRAFT_94632 [Sordaria sp. MPI-SDFR-AT-0083]|nr:hypothetical protein B0T09DRAFT_94632 [Sordaria sp. MPI-SDFR-AT-0083]
MPAPDETVQAVALAVMEMVVVVGCTPGSPGYLPCRYLYAYPYSCPAAPATGHGPCLYCPLSSAWAPSRSHGSHGMRRLGIWRLDCVHAHGVCSPKKIRPLSHLSSPTAPVLLRLGTALATTRPSPRVRRPRSSKTQTADRRTSQCHPSPARHLSFTLLPVPSPHYLPLGTATLLGFLSYSYTRPHRTQPF